jgi:hypothetical protein
MGDLGTLLQSENMSRYTQGFINAGASLNYLCELEGDNLAEALLSLGVPSTDQAAVMRCVREARCYGYGICNISGFFWGLGKPSAGEIVSKEPADLLTGTADWPEPKGDSCARCAALFQTGFNFCNMVSSTRLRYHAGIFVHLSRYRALPVAL